MRLGTRAPRLAPLRSMCDGAFRWGSGKPYGGLARSAQSAVFAGQCGQWRVTLAALANLTRHTPLLRHRSLHPLHVEIHAGEVLVGGSLAGLEPGGAVLLVDGAGEG